MFGAEATVIINFVSAVLITTLGFFVLHHDRRNKHNQLFALMTVSLAFWIFASTVSDLVHEPAQALYFADMAIIGPFFFICLLFFFSHAFPTPRKPMKRWLALAVALPPFLTLPLDFTKLNIESVTVESWGTGFVPGPLYTFLFAYILFALVLSVRELILKYREFKDTERRAQLKFLFFAVILTVVFGTAANLVLPLLGDARASTIGPASTLFFVLLTTYAIIKHHLLDVKVIAAELFSALLTIVTFFEVLTSGSVGEFGARLLLFVATAIVSILLVQSVIQEVRRREEVQRLAAQLEISNKRLQKLDELKTTMVSIASHQIRGPLGGMRGYFTMFRDGDLGPLTDKQKEIVRMNLNVLTRLLNAVETFLDITKLEAGKMTLRKEILPLDDAVSDVVKEFELPFQKKGLTLEFIVEAKQPVWVEFDPEKIKHVIFNLIDNALKYTETGGVKVRIRTEAANAVLDVTDTGMGIPAEDVPRLFGKFERGELVVDRGGSGLGLYVVKMLTEMQGGTIVVTSPGVGKGATFRVVLPLAKHE